MHADQLHFRHPKGENPFSIHPSYTTRENPVSYNQKSGVSHTKLIKFVMNKIIAIVAVLLIASDSLHAADEVGWNKVQWGMTPQQIIQAYPEARAVPKPDHFPQAGENFWGSINIDRFELAGGIYKVFFLMDAKNTLGGVLLARDGAYKLTTDADMIEKLLTQKYGRFSDMQDKPAGGRSVTWSRPGLTIILSNIVEPTISFFSIRLRYLRPNTKALDKL